MPRTQTVVLGVGVALCFGELLLAPKGADPGPWVAAILGILLLRRAIITAPQPALAVLSGSLLAAIVVAGDHGFLHVNKPLWICVIIVAGIGFAFAEKIERLWT